MGEKANRIREAQEWRRGKVLEYTSQGYTQREIAAILQVVPSTVAEDQIFLRQQAKENIRSYIDEKLPEEYEKCLVGITTILKEAWNTSKQDGIEVKEKLAALSLAKECYSMKLDLLTNATVMDDASKFVVRHKNKEANNNEKAGNSEEQQSLSLQRQPIEQPPQETEQEQQQEQEPETFNKTF